MQQDQKDTEGHLFRREDQTGDDSEGHFRRGSEDQTGDDSEGHFRRGT
jgi:hypothetical protein